MKNELEINIKDVGDSIFDEIASKFDQAYENVKSNKEYAPYGDGQAVVGEYVDEDDDNRIREQFEEDMDYETVLELIKNSPYVERAILDLVKYVALNREA